MKDIIKMGRDAMKRQQVAVVGNVSESSARALKGLVLAVETVQLDIYQQQQFIKSLLPVKPRETGLVSMTEMLAQALKDPENTGIVFDDTPVEIGNGDELAEVEELAVALESCGVKVFRSMREAVNWVNKETESISF